MTKLTGRVALITGAASGMGAAHARILRSEGASVAVCDVDIAAGEALAAEIGGAFYKLDVSSEADWTQALSSIAQDLGPVTILVNNAGICLMNPVEDASIDEWNQTMAVNATGTFLGIRGVTPQMAAAGGGVIVNISSSAALEGLPGSAAYNASKWAVRGLTKSAARDLARYNIRVLSLHPALVRTPMSAAVDLASATAHYPIPRPGEPEEIARMLLFMVAEASYSTGSEFVADGGSAT
jgi:3alpha(or 20beta)-hydroxysteroid dehydrogenase